MGLSLWSNNLCQTFERPSSWCVVLWGLKVNKLKVLVWKEMPRSQTFMWKNVRVKNEMKVAVDWFSGLSSFKVRARILRRDCKSTVFLHFKPKRKQVSYIQSSLNIVCAIMFYKMKVRWQNECKLKLANI